MKKYIIAGIVTLALLALIPLSAVVDRGRVERMKASGGAVGIVNQSHHRVEVLFFGHDSAGVVQRAYQIAPGDQCVLQDSMSEEEVLAFPPEGFADSALLVFDDSVLVWHKGKYPWEVGFDDHCIHNDVHWEYEGITVRRFNPVTGSRIIRRPVRRYILVDRDCEWAERMAASR